MTGVRLSIPWSAEVADHDIVNESSVRSWTRPLPAKACRQSRRVSLSDFLSNQFVETFRRINNRKLKIIVRIPKDICCALDTERVFNPTHEASGTSTPKLRFELVIKDSA